MERGELIAGRYELVSRLGRGGMGEVWAARDCQLRRGVALKLLVLDDGVAADLPMRFEREGVAARRSGRKGGSATTIRPRSPALS
ncbi:hypothetical protein ACWY4P_42380 [Streptomyces sp. LZ34]